MTDSEPPSYYEEPNNLAECLKKNPPVYKPSLEFFGICLMKTELNSPYDNVQCKDWEPVLLELNSTQLNVYSLDINKKLKDLIFALYYQENNLEELMQRLSKNRGESGKLSADDLGVDGDAYGGDIGYTAMHKTTAEAVKSSLRKRKINKSLKDLKEYYGDIQNNRMLFEPTKSEWDYKQFSDKYRGKQLYSWSLQSLNAGEAPSLNQIISSLYKEDDTYKHQNANTLSKFSNVLRVRIEIKQVLFQFWSFYGMVHWYRNLKIGKDLGLDLDERQITKLKSIPNRNSAVNNALLTAAEAAAAVTNVAITENANPNPEIDELFQQELDYKYDYQSRRVSVSSSDISSGTCSTISGAASLFESSSALSSIGSVDDVPTKTIGDFKLVSLQNYYTNIEKQYISNCIPNLNSFENWVGQKVIISNYKIFQADKFGDKQAQDTTSELKQNILITKNSLNSEKNLKKKNGSNPVLNDGRCRSFLIHDSGLVSIAV